MRSFCPLGLARPRMRVTSRHLPNDHGFTLVELMVGLAVGLIVVAAALTVLMASRALSGTTDDVANMQQQVSYAMRILGTQLRETASLYLNQDTSSAAATDDPLAITAFEIQQGDFNLANTASLLSGNDAPAANGFNLTAGYRNYPVTPFGKTAPEPIARDCLGASPSATLVQNRLRFDGTTNQLRCASHTAPGGAPSAQALISNVADFQLRYLVQAGRDAVTGAPSMQLVNASGVGNWGAVQAVAICLVLYGNEAVDLPVGSAYTGCDGTSVDMTQLSGARKNRLHRVFHDLIQLRSQGLLG